MEPITLFISAAQTIWQAIGPVWFLILPPLFYFVFKSIWMKYITDEHWTEKKYIVLEIIPPRDLEKSPRIMESFFFALAGIIKSPNMIEEYYEGHFFPFISLELVGTEGTAHFYIWLPENMRSLIESQLYAQYSDIEIFQVEDYVNQLPPVLPNKEWTLWGTDVKLVREDPYPIRTYKYFEEDVTGKMLDPLSSLVETVGKTGPGEHLWLQIIIQPQHESWYEEGLALVQDIAGRTKKRKGVFSEIGKDLMDVFSGVLKGLFSPVEFERKEEKDEQPLEFRLTPGEKDTLKAVENNISKNIFLTKMRFLYIGRREVFDKIFVSSFFGGLKQFNDQQLNNFAPDNRSKTYANYIWKDFRLAFRQRRIYRRYRNRFPTGVKFMLSTEELASIYHMPDMSVVAPSMQRIDARRSGAPANLPVE